jgi:hypothetical protein
MPSEPPDEAAIRAVLASLAAERGAGSFCPSDAARRLAPDWRGLLPQVRAVAASMVDEKALAATQRGAPVDPRTARGPIRLRHPG